MSLNKSTGNMYDFITHTWNTIKGECYHDCSYCYMKRWGKLNPVRFDEKELKTDLKDCNYIFVGSSCDMFAENIPFEWIFKTLQHCEKHNLNKYFFQTKNPKAFNDYAPVIAAIENFDLCITLESNRYYKEIGCAPNPLDRTYEFAKIPYSKKYVTIEPIMDFDVNLFVAMIKLINPLQVNIGADSGNNNLPEPSKEKVLALIDELQKITVIHKKTNLKRLLK